jgi:hypothetical protein
MTRPNGDYPQYPPQHQAQRAVLGAPAPAAAPPPAPAPDQAARVEAGPAPAPAVPRAEEALSRTGRSVIEGVATARAGADVEASSQTMSVTAAAPQAPGGGPPREGTVYGPRDDVEERQRPPSGRQPGLRIGWHTASLPALTTMGVSSPGIGLLLGADHDQKPVPVRFFRAEPTRITLVGGVWSAQLLAFRAMALGAQVVVMTVEPQAWSGFGERAVGRADRVVVLHGEQQGSIVGTMRQPALVIHDLGVTGPTAPPPIGPWQTHLTVLRRLDEHGVPAVQRCDLLILQRLHATEAAVAGTALRLTAQSAQLLQMMEDEMLALIGGGANRYLWLHPTAVERQFMGAAWR